MPTTRSAISVADAGVVVPAALPATQFPLDIAVDDLAVNGAFVIRNEGEAGGDVYGWTFVLKVVAAFNSSIKWGSLRGSTTFVTFDSAPGTGIDGLQLGDLQMFEVLDSFTIEAQGVPTATASGKLVYFFGSPPQAALMQGQSLAIVVPGVDSTTRTVVSVPDLSGADPETALLVPLTLDAEVVYADFDNDQPTATIYGNLVAATEGKTQSSAVLGNGDARSAFQTFRVPKSPLTYLVQPGATPPQRPELQLFVGDREWTEISAFYGRGPTEEVYVVRQDSAGDSWVQFGDGNTVRACRRASATSVLSGAWVPARSAR